MDILVIALATAACTAESTAALKAEKSYWFYQEETLMVIRVGNMLVFNSYQGLKRSHCYGEYSGYELRSAS